MKSLVLILNPQPFEVPYKKLIWVTQQSFMLLDAQRDIKDHYMKMLKLVQSTLERITFTLNPKNSQQNRGCI